MANFAQEFAKAAKESPRLYFAPLIGAIRGAITEWDRVIAESRSLERAQKVTRMAAEADSDTA